MKKEYYTAGRGDNSFDASGPGIGPRKKKKLAPTPKKAGKATLGDHKTSGGKKADFYMKNKRKYTGTLSS